MYERFTNVEIRKESKSDCWPEYSQPLDRVGRTLDPKKRVGLPPTPQQDQVEFLEAYSDPRDSRRSRPDAGLDCTPGLLDSSGQDRASSQYLCAGPLESPTGPGHPRAELPYDHREFHTQGRSSGEYPGKGRSLASGEFPSQEKSSGEYPGQGRSSGEYPAQGRSSGEYPGKGRSLASGEFPSQEKSSGEYLGQGRSSGEYPGQGRSSGEYPGKGRSLASGEFPSQGRSSGEYHGHGRSSCEYPGRSLASSDFPCQGRPCREFAGSEAQLRPGEECQGFLESPGQGRASPPEPAPSHPTGRYKQPYTTDGSSDEASSSDLSLERSVSGRVLSLPAGPRHPPRYAVPKRRQDRINEKKLQEVAEHAYANVPSGRGRSNNRQPSPYYYGDLARCGKSASLEAPVSRAREPVAKRFSVTEDGLFLREGEEDEDEDEDDDEEESSSGGSMPPRRSCACRPQDDFPRAVFYLGTDMTARARRLYETAFDCKVARSDDDLDDVDRVSNHPILLQLTGDGRVLGVDTFASSSSSNVDPLSSIVTCEKTRRKITSRSDNGRRPKPVPNRLQNESSVVSMLSEELEHMELNNPESQETTVSRLPLRGYTPSPPSTAPLPTKFQQSKDLAMNSIKSAPNLPSQPTHPRLKDLRLPVKSLRARESPASSDGSMIEIKERSNNNTEFECGNRVRNMIQDSQERISEIKGRPRLHNGLFLEIKGRPASDTDTPHMHRYRKSKESGPILEFKGRPANRRRHNYSSTESMATSSSGGSMESLRSSTSEGNRSTSSSDSRHSTSLSSHSSDSGNNSRFQNMHHASPLSGFISHHANKLHILSPISDKSSQEPVSETSDNNRNNNSQKVSPEDTENVMANQQGNVENNSSIKFKRRPPLNKNLLNLAFQHATAGETEIQGSDSGISIHSRDGMKSRNAFLGFLKLNQPVDNSTSSIAVDANNCQVDFSDLPFDMPKLRRRKAAAQDACTSGSATSVDLRELPFDMPKLRRRLRAPASSSPASSGGSHASSSHSVQDAEKAQGGPRPNLTLNLEDKAPAAAPLAGHEPPKGLNLNFGASSNVPVLADVVDTALSLDSQGWYHGAMTRLEAEAVLRGAAEGGFLVRNSESARRDYSLSLKSARGFMHMRIQKSEETGKYILGQFSRPFDTIPEMIRHFCLNRLPVRGAEHMCLSIPVIAQLL